MFSISHKIISENTNHRILTLWVNNSLSIFPVDFEVCFILNPYRKFKTDYPYKPYLNDPLGKVCAESLRANV